MSGGCNGEHCLHCLVLPNSMQVCEHIPLCVCRATSLCKIFMKMKIRKGKKRNNINNQCRSSANIKKNKKVFYKLCMAILSLDPTAIYTAMKFSSHLFLGTSKAGYFLGTAQIALRN